MRLRLVPLSLLLLALAACNGPRESTAASGPLADGGAPEDAPMGGDGLVGTWERVAQEGYPGDPPDVGVQRLTFFEGGRMTVATEVGGERLEQEMQYRLEGDQLVQISGAGTAVAQVSRWSLDGDRLTIEQPQTGYRDVYRRLP
ncbi:MAG: hypothetical protein R3181_09025 [Rubricoccaceae bacterium]|nr:hypothetical protein [Rubricoccaceae bacterium]